MREKQILGPWEPPGHLSVNTSTPRIIFDKLGFKPCRWRNVLNLLELGGRTSQFTFDKADGQFTFPAIFGAFIQCEITRHLNEAL